MELWKLNGLPQVNLSAGGPLSGKEVPVPHAHRLYSHDLCNVKDALSSFAALPLLYPCCQFPHLQIHTWLQHQS